MIKPGGSRQPVQASPLVLLLGWGGYIIDAVQTKFQQPYCPWLWNRQTSFWASVLGKRQLSRSGPAQKTLPKSLRAPRPTGHNLLSGGRAAYILSVVIKLCQDGQCNIESLTMIQSERPLTRTVLPNVPALDGATVSCMPRHGMLALATPGSETHSTFG